MTERPPSNTDPITAHPVLFEGRGGEFFRVWTVNVLLTLVTLGLYTPFARRRTVQYFYSHTQVAGSPLEFTAQPRKMFFGFLLLVFFYLAFKVASDTGQTTVVSVMLLGGAVLAPYLWGSAMRFRLASTRWRGVRLQFNVPWREVYLASWPVFALAAIWIVFIFVLAGVMVQAPAGAGRLQDKAWLVAGLALLALGASVLCVIRLSFNYQSLLVLRTSIGNQTGRWKPLFRDFVRIWLAAVGVFLLSVLVCIALALALGGLGLQGALASKSAPQAMLFIGLITLGSLAGTVLAAAPALAYREARMFHLIWNNVGLGQVARFKCRLVVRRFVGLRLMNLVLTLLTLGLYRPFARVSEYAMKTRSVTLHVKGGVNQLAGQLVAQQGALGDAIADAVGLDVIG